MSFPLQGRKSNSSKLQETQVDLALRTVTTQGGLCPCKIPLYTCKTSPYRIDPQPTYISQIGSLISLTIIILPPCLLPFWHVNHCFSISPKSRFDCENVLTKEGTRVAFKKQFVKCQLEQKSWWRQKYKTHRKIVELF